MATTAPSTASPTPARRRHKAWVLPNWAYGVGLVALVLAFIAGLTMMFGRVSGEEFSPDHFKRRTFSFYEIPILGVQIWPVKHIDVTGDVETEVVTNKLIEIKTDEKPRWDLVLGYRGSAQVAEGYANILCQYLDRLDGKGGRTWQTWTQEKPKLAKVLWPHIAKLAQEELYIFMPDVFELAAQARDTTNEDITALDTAIKAQLALRYREFAIAQRKLNRHQVAVELLTEATKLAPDEKAWQEELDTWRKALPAEEEKS